MGEPVKGRPEPQIPPNCVAGEGGVVVVLAAEADAGERLDVFLARELVRIVGEAAGITRSRVQRMLRDGLVADPAGGPVQRGAARVRGGQAFRVHLPAPEQSSALPEEIQLDVVYEDQYLIVVNKPRGMVVHPAAGHRSGTLVNALLAHCPELATADGDALRPGIVHRLDRDTTGLIVAAKDAGTRLALQEMIKRRNFEKTYLALVRGVPGSSSGEVEGNIGRSGQDRKRMAVVSAGGRAALTRWRILAAAGGHALLEVKPHTGRTHQIRVHLAHLGFPVAGDPVYGGKKGGGRGELAGQALHAWRLEFRHPVSGRVLSLTAPLPADFREMLRALGIPAPQ